MNTKVRKERQFGDQARIRAVHLACFPTEFEADVVKSLRGVVDPWLSWVAEADGRVVAHALYTPVTLEPDPDRRVRVVALTLMAVHPEFQAHGIGSALGDASLQELGRQNVDAVVAAGHAGWYQRFGFKPARRFGLVAGHGTPADGLLAVELVPGALRDIEATVNYVPQIINTFTQPSEIPARLRRPRAPQPPPPPGR